MGIIGPMPDNPPPAGTTTEAQKYINSFVGLLNQDKIAVTHTNLDKFNPSSIQDHYKIDLGEYEVEVSHSRHPDSGQNFYVMLFNNLQKLRVEYQDNSNPSKAVLAYLHLTEEQFKYFKTSATNYLERRGKEEEEVRFKEAISPIDKILDYKLNPEEQSQF